MRKPSFSGFLKKSFIGISGALASAGFCEEESDLQPLKEFTRRNATMEKEIACRSDVDFIVRMDEVCFGKRGDEGMRIFKGAMGRKFSASATTIS
jgi:hypothetical protein